MEIGLESRHLWAPRNKRRLNTKKKVTYKNSVKDEMSRTSNRRSKERNSKVHDLGIRESNKNNRKSAIGDKVARNTESGNVNGTISQTL